VRAFAAALIAQLLLSLGTPAPAMAQRALTFQFACEFDMNQLSEANLDRANVPDDLRDNVYLENGEKRCTFSNNPVTQIRCEGTVDDWPNPPSISIRTFEERCQWFLEQDECGVQGRVFATNQSLIIEPVDADTARLRLFCSSRIPPE
jgi:hypothetical protein